MNIQVLPLTELKPKMKTEGKPNHLQTTTLKRVLLLLCVLGSQIYICKCQSSSAVSASGINCTPECGLGYRCESENGEPTCVKKTNLTSRPCNRSCENKTRAEVCGTDGVTYKNRCELRKARCQLEKEINVTYPGPCITLPPPPEHLCKTSQNQFDNMDPDDYQRMCNYDDLQRKASDNTLTLKDLLPCYRPQCTNDAFRTRQCSSNVDGWCWCSTPDGFAIEGTLQRNLPAGACDSRRSCEYQGQTHKDGELFSPNGCGYCECLNGTVSCFEDYVPDNSGRLNASQLGLLKDEVMQVFHFQHSHNEHVLINIRHVHQQQVRTTIESSQRNAILLWKFHHYDRNNDDVLFPAEEFIFQMELYEFVKCKSFFDHVSELIDDDSNGQISLQEWLSFFNEDDSSATPTSGLGSSSTSSSGSISISATQPSKRSVPPVLRKPLNLRKKFLYVLF